MSATTYTSGAARYTAQRFNASRMLKGVCAEIAERAGVAVWLPRAAFIVFGLLHWFLAVVLYVVLVKMLAPARQRLRQRFGQETSRNAGCGPIYRDVRDRFTTLDARLADLESASLHQEASLRREFRDLERR